MNIILSNLITEPWFISVLVIAVIVVVVLSIFLGIFLARNATKRRVKELENEYDQIHNTFTVDSANMIMRIETISKHNDSFEQIYITMAEKFNSIKRLHDDDCKLQINSAKELLQDKKYKELNPVIESTKESLEKFRNEGNTLNLDLQGILKQEDDCRNLIISSKEKFRKLKEAYEKENDALASLEDRFAYLFKYVIDKFEEFENLLTEAKYKEASQIIPEVDSLIDACTKVMGELPYLNTLCDRVVPDKIEELTQSYVNLENENYPLHHLLVKSKIENMNNRVKFCKDRLEQLSTSGVYDILNGITKEINELNADFEKEKDSKKKFDEAQPKIYNSTYEAQKQFANLTNSLPSYQDAYVINQTYIDQMDEIKDMIDDMATNKRKLDMYINSSTKQPYSILLKTMDELNEKITKVQNAFNDFHSYLKGLKRDTENCFAYIRKGFVEIHELEFKLREIHVASSMEAFNIKFNNAMNMLCELDAILSVAPIDVNVLIYKFKDTYEYIEALKASVNEDIDMAKKAEDAIVYDNQIRQNSDIIAQTLDSVEKSFGEGDFSRSYNQAINLFKSHGGENAR